MLDEFVEALVRWRWHPAAMVEELFGVTPDTWQRDTLEVFPYRPRIALQACKGPGKTALLAWLSWNFLLTRDNPKMAATSIDFDNLSANLWPEMALWQSKSELLKEKFTWTKTRIVFNERPETWFMDARAWPKSADKQRQADTLAGYHAPYVMFVIDESGSIPLPVLVSAEAALSNCIEGHIVQGGNPTMLDGMLYAASVDRARWHVVEITGDPDDPKRSPRISIEWARDQIKKYGAENPWIRVNVFGRFPQSSINALIGVDEVSAAMKRYYRDHEIGQASRVLGVDVAREGDDKSVIFPRQGIQAFTPSLYRNIDSTQGAGQVSRKWADWNADAAFIDNTGGFGAGWIDQLVLLGRTPIGVHFSGEAHQKSRYYNKRAEMYFDAVEWIKLGGALPDSPDLIRDLVQTTYTHKGDRLILEPKEIVKQKLGRSPDEADAFVLTFAEPVTPKSQIVLPRRQQPVYDPFAEMETAHHTRAYDPFGGSQ